METKDLNLQLKKGEISVRMVSFLDLYKLLKKNKEFLNKVIREIKNLRDEDHIGGFLNEGYLKRELEFNAFDKKQANNIYPKTNLEFEKVLTLTKEVINKIKDILGERDILIYVFPTASSFTAKNMEGSSGFLAWRDIIHIYLYPTRNWKINFQSTLLHELTHCMQDYYLYDMSLFNHLVADGLAEHFQESLLNGKRNPWTKAITKREAKQIFKKIRSLLEIKMSDQNFSIHADLFFGSDEYPLWTGYTIGYYLVSDYLRKEKNLDWSRLFSKEPKDLRNIW